MKKAAAGPAHSALPGPAFQPCWPVLPVQAGRARPDGLRTTGCTTVPPVHLVSMLLCYAEHGGLDARLVVPEPSRQLSRLSLAGQAGFCQTGRKFRPCRCASQVLTAVALQCTCLTLRLIGCRMAAVLAMCRRPWGFLPYGAGKGTDYALEQAAAEQLTVPSVWAADAGLHGPALCCCAA